MTGYLMSLLASFLDPVRFVVCLVIVALFTYSRGLYVSVIVSAIVSFIVMEALLKQSQGLRVFGEGFLWGFPASLIHGYLSYLLITYFKRRRA